MPGMLRPDEYEREINNNQTPTESTPKTNAMTKSMTKHITAAAALALTATLASGQSASVAVSASSTTVAPGGSFTVSLQTTFDTNGAGSGVFGDSGFYGFGGTVTATGPAASALMSSVPAINGSLAFGPVAQSGAGMSLATAAAGRGLEGGITGDPGDLIVFDVTVDAGAPEGDVTLDFDGAVVLVLDSTLATYSTDPGLNQQTLPTTSLTITIGDAGCNNADLAEPLGVLDLGDISAFVAGFLGMDPSVDFNDDGVFDLADIGAFVADFTAGCP